MKLVIQGSQPYTSSKNAWRDVILEKQVEDAGIDILHPHTQEKILSITTLRDDRLGFTMLSEAGAVFLDKDGNPYSRNLPEMASSDESPSISWGDDGKPSFMVDEIEDEVIFYRSRNDAGIRIKKHVGEVSSPAKNWMPIFDQPRMVFDLALGALQRGRTMLSGPAGTGKTEACAMLAGLLNWNFVPFSITRNTEMAHMLGDFFPDGKGGHHWVDGEITRACRLSNEAPTLLLIDEMNRIGNVAEYSCMYPILDGRQTLPLPTLLDDAGRPTSIPVGDLYVVATRNPADSMMANYVGVQDLDDALLTRFELHPKVEHLPKEKEAAIVSRLTGITPDEALAIAGVIDSVRTSNTIRFPAGMREGIAWGKLMRYYGFVEAGDVALVGKLPVNTQLGVQQLIKSAYSRLRTY